MTTVGSQDTTGPMTRDELKDLACLGFSADLVMQSFCHTAAYPKPVDVVRNTIPPAVVLCQSTRGPWRADGVAVTRHSSSLHRASLVLPRIHQCSLSALGSW